MKSTLKVMVTVILAMVAIFALSTAAFAASDAVSDVFSLVNEERANAGLSNLSLNEDLNRVAQLRAKELEEQFAHTRPDGREWKTAFIEEGVAASYRGENLAKGQGSAQSVMDAWMNSQGHKKNILDNNFSEMGIASVEIDGVKYWVQVFANDVKTTNKAKSEKNNQTAVEEVTVIDEEVVEEIPVTVTAKVEGNGKTSSNNTASNKSDNASAPVIDLNVVQQRTAATPILASNPGL